MDASLTMIDRHYGHLARDGREHAIKLLDALNAPWTLVDAAWTPGAPAGVGPENENNDSPCRVVCAGFAAARRAHGHSAAAVSRSGSLG